MDLERGWGPAAARAPLEWWLQAAPGEGLAAAPTASRGFSRGQPGSGAGANRSPPPSSEWWRTTRASRQHGLAPVHAVPDTPWATRAAWPSVRLADGAPVSIWRGSGFVGLQAPDLDRGGKGWIWGSRGGPNPSRLPAVVLLHATGFANKIIDDQATPLSEQHKQEQEFADETMPGDAFFASGIDGFGDGSI